MFKTGTLTLALALPFAVTQAFAADESKALETNFTYSQLGIGLGVINFDDSIIIAGDEYDGLAFLTLSGSVQIVENVVLGLSLNGAASEGDNSEISASAAILSIAVPIPVGERTDIVPLLGYGTYSAEVCIFDTCAEEDDSAASYGISARFWAVPDQVELNLGISDTTLEDSEATLSAGFGGWIHEHHRLGVNLSLTDDQTAYGLGYSYNW